MKTLLSEEYFSNLEYGEEEEIPLEETTIEEVLTDRGLKIRKFEEEDFPEDFCLPPERSLKF